MTDSHTKMSLMSIFVIVLLADMTDGFVLKQRGEFHRIKRESLTTASTTDTQSTPESDVSSTRPLITRSTEESPSHPTKTTPISTISTSVVYMGGESLNNNNTPDTTTPTTTSTADMSEPVNTNSANVTNSDSGSIPSNRSEAVNISGSALIDMFQFMMSSRDTSTVIIPETGTGIGTTDSQILNSPTQLVTSTMQPIFPMTETEILIRKLATDILIQLFETFVLKASTLNGPAVIPDIIRSLKASQQHTLTPSSPPAPPAPQYPPATTVWRYPNYVMWPTAGNGITSRTGARRGWEQEGWEELTGFESESEENLSIGWPF